MKRVAVAVDPVMVDALTQKPRWQPANLAPLPPRPADESRCRWCGERRVEVLGRWICSRMCAQNDQAPYSYDCEDCRRPYWTGQPHDDRQCYACATREIAQLTAAYAEPERSNYERRRTRESMLRHVAAPETPDTVPELLKAKPLDEAMKGLRDAQRANATHPAGRDAA
jgi:hypothetical protein